MYIQEWKDWSIQGRKTMTGINGDFYRLNARIGIIKDFHSMSYLGKFQEQAYDVAKSVYISKG